MIVLRMLYHLSLPAPKTNACSLPPFCPLFRSRLDPWYSMDQGLPVPVVVRNSDLCKSAKATLHRVKKVTAAGLSTPVDLLGATSCDLPVVLPDSHQPPPLTSSMSGVSA